jgi:hypothetical protein
MYSVSEFPITSFHIVPHSLQSVTDPVPFISAGYILNQSLTLFILKIRAYQSETVTPLVSNYLICEVFSDRLCGLVFRVPGYRSRVASSIPGSTRFMRSSCSGTGSTPLRSYLEQKSSASGLESREYGSRDPSR